MWRYNDNVCGVGWGCNEALLTSPQAASLSHPFARQTSHHGPFSSFKKVTNTIDWITEWELKHNLTHGFKLTYSSIL